MRTLLLLALMECLLSGFLRDIVFGSGGGATASEPQQEPLRDAETGEVIKMWVPKNMLRTSSWEFQARGEEARCSSGYYKGKNVADLFPSQRTIYKELPNYGNSIWAYYYGEDIPGFGTTDWYITVFNIYADKNGRIYGCLWQKFPSEYRLEYGTSDGIRP